MSDFQSEKGFLALMLNRLNMLLSLQLQSANQTLFFTYFLNSLHIQGRFFTRNTVKISNRGDSSRSVLIIYKGSMCACVCAYVSVCLCVCFKPAGLTHTQNVITLWFFWPHLWPRNGLFSLLLSPFVDFKGKQIYVSKTDT